VLQISEVLLKGTRHLYIVEILTEGGLCFGRYQLFLQLKRDLLNGRLQCSTDDAAELAALSLQC